MLKSCITRCRYKEDQQKEINEAAEKAKLASMTDEERRRWELENPKVPADCLHALPSVLLCCTANPDQRKICLHCLQADLPKSVLPGIVCCNARSTLHIYGAILSRRFAQLWVLNLAGTLLSC